jgi:hypothetical protein
MCVISSRRLGVNPGRTTRQRHRVRTGELAAVVLVIQRAASDQTDELGLAKGAARALELHDSDVAQARPQRAQAARLLVALPTVLAAEDGVPENQIGN